MFLEKYANFNGWSEHNEVGIFTLMELSKEFDLSWTVKKLVDLQEIKGER